MITNTQYTVAPATSAESKQVTRLEKPKLNAFQFHTVWVVEDNHPVSTEPRGVLSKYRDLKEIAAGMWLAKMTGHAETFVDRGCIIRQRIGGAEQLA
jgi:hypothetical protein